MPRLAFTSQPSVLGAAPLAPIPDEWAMLCGGVSDADTNFYPRLASPFFRKVVAKLAMPATPTSGSFSVDTCTQTSLVDTILSVLACDSGTSGCTCYSNDDGCATGYPLGSNVTVPWTAGMTYWVIAYPYAANSPQPGSFAFTVSDPESPQLPSVSYPMLSAPFFPYRMTCTLSTEPTCPSLFHIRLAFLALNASTSSLSFCAQHSFPLSCDVQACLDGKYISEPLFACLLPKRQERVYFYATKLL